MRSVRVRVPATSANLGPGFDCLGMAFDRGLEVRAQPASSDSFQGLGEARDLTGENNLVFSAADALFAEIGRPRPKLAIVCDSEIPLARGLGSSAAAIAAGLIVGDALAGSLLSRQALLELATRLEGHPDNVAPALLGGVTAAVLGSEGVSVCPVPLAPEIASRLGLVAAIPPFELSTAEARAALPATVGHRDAVFNAGRAALLVATLASGRLDLLAEALADRLHEPFRAPLIEGCSRVAGAARGAGAFGVTISGSGPTLLAWCPKEAAGAVGAAMQEVWGPLVKVGPVAIAQEGARVV